MSDTTKIYSYLLGSLDHLISAYCLEYNINKEAALKYYIIPKLAKEFNIENQAQRLLAVYREVQMGFRLNIRE